MLVQVFHQLPAGREAIEAIHLVETSLNMRQQQERKLAPTATERNWDLQWHMSLHEVPHDPTKFTLLVAHEFFDALPFNLIQVCPPTPRF